jgi:hypothetical protein
MVEAKSRACTEISMKNDWENIFAFEWRPPDRLLKPDTAVS